MSAKERRSVGDDVLEDLDAAMKSGTLGAIAPTARTYSTPTKLGQAMIEGAGQTISRQKDAIEDLSKELNVQTTDLSDRVRTFLDRVRVA